MRPQAGLVAGCPILFNQGYVRNLEPKEGTPVTLAYEKKAGSGPNQAAENKRT